MSREAPFARNGFKTEHPIAMRWADIDRYGHVNNVSYLAWFDTVVNDHYLAHDFLGPDRPYFIVARTGCTFFREVRYGDRITIGQRVARLGGSSVTYDLAVFANDEIEARAQGQYVHVLVSSEQGTPIPIKGPLRAMLEGMTA